MTLATYVAYLVSTGNLSVYLPDVLDDFAKIEAFLAYSKATLPYTLSTDAIAEVKAGRKISAIKIVRAEHPQTLAGRTLGLKEAKDIVDAYVAAHPEQYNVAPRPYNY